MTYLAHIRCNNGSDKEVQTVEAHCRRCAQYALEKSIASLGNGAYLAGLLHDMGKYTAAFLEYITLSSLGEPVRRGSVNHTFAGVRFVMERWHLSGEPTFRNMACEMIATAIGSHHGMFDCIDPNGKDGFLHRQTTQGISYEEAREQFLLHCADLEELDKLFDAAEKEITEAVAHCKPYIKTEEELRFCLSLLTRMLLSAVIDADRRDTAEFMHAVSLPAGQKDLKKVWQSCLDTMESKLGALPAKLPIDEVRRKISHQCRQAAKRECGIYHLSVPTGGGKTLASLRYALAAATEHQKKRIIFTIPLLSVLEQNAAVIREFIEDDSLILEHHSNLVGESTKIDELDDNELLMETWDAPIIITTLVQLLNTLFLGKTTCVRRMQALADSVIIIDEVQSVPRKMLSLFNMAMNFLASLCNATIILCSATQPCLEDIPHALHCCQPYDLIPTDAAMWETFRRTEIFDKRKKGGYTTQELAEFALDCMSREDSLLIICNTKSEARALYTAVGQATDASVFHLSTAMCMEHRIHTLAQINICLTNKHRVICVSTQLVEAGVDFSFACVIRVSAGLDNIIQAAGRCNRSGEFGRLCPVYVVNLKEENLSHLKEIRQSQLAAESVLAQYAKSPHHFANNLASAEAIRAYYRRLYTDMPDNAPDYPLVNMGSTLFTLLSDNRTFVNHSASKGKYIITQAFQTAGSTFSVFDNQTTDSLVPYGKGEELIAQLQSERAKRDFAYRKELLEKAKVFSISLYHYEVEHLQKTGGLYSIIDDAVLVLQGDFYSQETGYDPSGQTNRFMEV